LQQPKRPKPRLGNTPRIFAWVCGRVFPPFRNRRKKLAGRRRSWVEDQSRLWARYLGGSALEPANFWSIIDTLESDRWDSIWLSERSSGRTFGPIAAIAAVAGRTRRLKFGFSVLVLPGRNPVLLAKELATIDALSNGRLIAAFGLGVEDPQEQAVFGVVDRKEAAARSEEAVRLIQRLWTETGVTHEGRHFHVRNFTLLPRPVQMPTPDIWFGGNSRAALRRTAELGTGWLPSFLTPEEYRADADEIRTLAAAAGRTIDPEHFGVLIAYVAPRDRARAQDFLSLLAAVKRGADLDTLLVFGDDGALRERIEHSLRPAPASSSSCRWSRRQAGPTSSGGCAIRSCVPWKARDNPAGRPPKASAP
jgi:probable F420-dependent oxidoreductase